MYIKIDTYICILGDDAPPRIHPEIQHNPNSVALARELLANTGHVHSLRSSCTAMLKLRVRIEDLSIYLSIYLSITIYYYLLLLITIYYNLFLSITITRTYYDLLRSITIYYYLLLFVTISYHLLPSLGSITIYIYLLPSFTMHY